MNENLQPTPNRRREIRNYQNCPVFVRGILANGKRLKVTTVTDDFSKGGLFLQLPYLLECGAQLFAFIRLHGSTGLAVSGHVVRTEKKERGLTGVAVRFDQTRLLPIPIQ